jgi:hypothetical protein
VLDNHPPENVCKERTQSVQSFVSERRNTFCQRPITRRKIDVLCLAPVLPLACTRIEEMVTRIKCVEQAQHFGPADSIGYQGFKHRRTIKHHLVRYSRS